MITLMIITDWEGHPSQSPGINLIGCTVKSSPGGGWVGTPQKIVGVFLAHSQLPGTPSCEY